MKIKIIAAIAAFAVIALNAGCSTVYTGLVGDTRANVGPFAQETINALVVEQNDFRGSELIYLRDLVDKDTPEIVRLRYLLSEVTEFRRQLVLYSLELVRVTDMNSTEEDQIAALADAISRQMRHDYVTLLNVDGTEFDAMIAEVRAQEKFLEAVNAVEPIINIAANHHSSILDEIEDVALPATRDYVDRRITDEFGVFLEHLDYMAERKDQLLIGLRLIREARLGNAEAIPKLRQANIILAKSALPPANASEKDLDLAEKYVIKELKKQDKVGELLAQDRADYLAMRAELEREINEIATGIRGSRIRVNAWLRAHDALASGVKDPGKWLSTALGIAGSARSAL
jgi:hypothetical protein